MSTIAHVEKYGMKINGYVLSQGWNEDLQSYGRKENDTIVTACKLNQIFLFYRSELENRAQQLEKDLYYYKKTSRDLKKKLREKMVSGMGTSVESDVFMASSELEAQHKSTDVYTKQLATDVSRMKVNIPLVIL